MVSKNILLSTISAYLVPVLVFWLLLTVLIVFKGNKDAWVWLSDHDLIRPSDVSQGMQWLTGPIMLTAILTLIYSRNDPSAWMLILGSQIFAFYLYLPLHYKFFQDQQSPAAIFGPRMVPLFIPGQATEHSFPSAHALSVAVSGTGLGWLHRNIKGWQTALAIMCVGFTFLSVFNGLEFPIDILISSVLGTLVTLFVISLYGPLLESWFDKRNVWLTGILIAATRTLAITLIIIQLFGGIHL